VSLSVAKCAVREGERSKIHRGLPILTRSEWMGDVLMDQLLER
jgi:hypothetical protein